MKITVKVKANSKVEKVEKIGTGSFVLWVKASAKEGKANAAMIGVLSRYFNVPKSSIAILQGHARREKVISVEGVPFI